MSESEHKPRHRLHIADLHSGVLEARGDVVRYVRNVLRLSVGDERHSVVEAFDGQGHYARAKLTSIERDRLVLSVDEVQQQTPAPCALTLLVATPKGERADTLVEKATELGVQRIVWTQCQRSVRVPRSSGSRGKRWQRIAIEAARQCGRSDIPLLEGPVELSTALEAATGRRFVAAAGGKNLQAVLHDAPLQLPGQAVVAIGPEGGWTDQELGLAQQTDYTIVGLGNWILRVETAAIAAASVLLGI